MSAQVPIQVQLVKAQDSVPPKSALVGGTIWELKYDGYRAPLRVAAEGAELWSRNGSNLSSHFPDLIAAAEAQLAAGVVLDGEAVVWLDGRLNFDQLQRRMVSRPAVAAKLAREHPASYVAFDLLTLDGQDLRPHPWRDRRAALEDLASTWRPPLQLSPYTDDYDTALEWLVDYRVAGVEGLVAKGAGSPYRPRQPRLDQSEVTGEPRRNRRGGHRARQPAPGRGRRPLHRHRGTGHRRTHQCPVDSAGQAAGHRPDPGRHR
jgi:ATP-dependent DNA ligase